MKPAAPPTASRAGAYEALLKEQPLAPALIQPMPVATHGGLAWWERHAIGGWVMFVLFGLGMLVAATIGAFIVIGLLGFLLLVTIIGFFSMFLTPIRLWLRYRRRSSNPPKETDHAS